MSDRDDIRGGFEHDRQDESARYRYPEEFGQLTIGSPINADMAKVWPLRRAFNPRKLANSGLLDITGPMGEYELTAGASNSQIQDTSGWNASGSIKLNFGIADFSAKFYLQQEKNACQQSTRATLAGRNVKTCKLYLIDEVIDDQTKKSGTTAPQTASRVNMMRCRRPLSPPPNQRVRTRLICRS